MTILMFETCYLVHRLLGADIMELVQLRLCGQDEDHSGEDDNKQREEGVDLQQTIIIYPMITADTNAAPWPAARSRDTR